MVVVLLWNSTTTGVVPEADFGVDVKGQWFSVGLTGITSIKLATRVVDMAGVRAEGKLKQKNTRPAWCEFG